MMNIGYKNPSAMKLPSKLFTSYDVYEENGKSLILSQKNVEISMTQLDNGKYSYKLDIPFKLKLVSYQKRSFLKNIVIEDDKGNICEGNINDVHEINI